MVSLNNKLRLDFKVLQRLGRREKIIVEDTNIVDWLGGLT